MNLIAHAILSPPNRKVRVGNVCADFIGRKEVDSLDADILKGFRRHHAIDTFTDNHPVTQRAKQRLVGFQRFGNPLVDVFFDHFLVQRFHQVSDLSVPDFVDELYKDLMTEAPNLPENARMLSGKVIQDDWLNSYDDFDGLARALTRMEHRLEWTTGREIDLVSSLDLLRLNYDDFSADFAEFWPDLYREFSPAD